MHILKFITAGAALLFAAIPLVAAANPPLDSLPGVSDGPSLSWSQEKFTNEGYTDRSRVNAARSGDRAMVLSEEGPDDSAVGLAIDPVSGEILSGKRR
jgi:hypothetical protein